jgi:hypothetical protein
MTMVVVPPLQIRDGPHVTDERLQQHGAVVQTARPAHVRGDDIGPAQHTPAVGGRDRRHARRVVDHEVMDQRVAKRCRRQPAGLQPVGPDRRHAVTSSLDGSHRR